MVEIQFYRTEAGACPVEEFLDSLNAKQAQKILWVLRAVRELPQVPKQYFKKLEWTSGLWEVRAEFGGHRQDYQPPGIPKTQQTEGVLGLPRKRKRHRNAKSHWLGNVNGNS